MGGKKSREKERYWQDLVNRQPRSGLSIREFCVQEGVSEPSFFGWRKKLRGERGSEARQVASSGDAGPASSGGEFIPLELIESPPAVEVIHPRGYRVRVTGHIATADLQRLFDVLDGRREA